jgi:hypothetical protein
MLPVFFGNQNKYAVFHRYYFFVSYINATLTPDRLVSGIILCLAGLICTKLIMVALYLPDFEMLELVTRNEIHNSQLELFIES